MWIRGLFLVVFFSLSAQAVEENCKLVVRTTLKDGRKRVQVIEETTATRQECQALAQKRELDSTDENVQSVKASFGWRAIAE